MIQKILILMAAIGFNLNLAAQAPHKPRISPEEFRARQEAFLTDKAELTQEEAARFFPIYFELQDKKRVINDKAWQQVHKGREAGTTDAEYEQIVEDVIRARIASNELDLEYLKRFKKILSPSKLFKVQRAEMKFHRHLFKIMHQAHTK